MTWQVIATFGAPFVALAILYGLDLFSGYKTSLGSGFAGLVAGVEMVDLSFLPPDIATALASGSALAAVAANSRWVSERK